MLEFTGTRRPVALLLHALIVSTVLAAVPQVASAQSSRSGDQTYDPSDPYAADRQVSQRRQAAQEAAREAAASQVASPEGANERYQPDEIRESQADRPRDERTRAEDRDTDSTTADRAADRRLRAARRPRPPSEFETYVSEVVDKPLRRFGSQLLVPEARDFTAPPTATVPLDYRLNPGDEIVVGLTGSIQANDVRLTIDSDGRVFLPRIGAVTVGGVRYGDVQSTIARQVSRQYRDFRVAVSIGRLRGITVYVTGFAAQPGSYTISSLSTLVNAVLAAGGPSAGGSFRSIQVRRQGRLISDFDLYDLLLKGDKSADVILQEGDVLYVAPVGAQVAVIGSVNNEAIFESGPGETLNDALLFAGGVNTVADDSRVLVLDSLATSATGWAQLTPAEIRTRAAKRGEILRVLSGVGLARPLAQQPVLVTISGEVTRPGRYYVPAGTPLAGVIDTAGGLTRDAYPFATVLSRESVRQTQRVSYDRALRDVELALTAQPLTAYNSSEQLQPARLQAVASVVAQLRERTPNGRLVLDLPTPAAPLPGRLVIENNDTIYVPPRPTTVGVFGAVPSPSSFQFRKGETIGDLLARAGGVQKIGDRNQIFVVRANGAVLSGKGGVFNSGVRGKPALPGDLIFVPVDASRGEFWAKLRDLTQILFQGALAAATVASVTE